MAKLPFWTPSSAGKMGKITIEVYRKPTHTDRYLDFNSHHEKKHKISTASTLLNRACNLPSTADAKSKEVKHIFDTLKANGYPQSIISNILKKKRATETLPSPEEMVGLFFKWVEPPETFDFACLPYINGLTEPLKRLLQNPWNSLSSPDPKEPATKSFLHHLLATFKQMWSTRFLAMTAVGATLEKRADVYRHEKKNTSEMLNIAAKDRTLQTMHG